MPLASSASLTVLLVEDNPGDVDLIREFLRESGARLQVEVARDGLEALAYVRREGPFRHAPPPDLIILDLNLPRKDGRAVLAEIMSDPASRQVPVIVLSSSSAPSDLVCAYDLHANAFVTKPVDLEQFGMVVKSIEQFWTRVCHLPTRSRGPGRDAA